MKLSWISDKRQQFLFTTNAESDYVKNLPSLFAKCLEVGSPIFVPLTILYRLMNANSLLAVILLSCIPHILTRSLENPYP